MKVIELRDTFGVDALKIAECPDPVPGPGQVVLKMRAFAINYRYLLVVNGVGQWRPSLPRIPLSDGVGIVAAVGTGVSRMNVGDRVAPIFYPMFLQAAYAQTIVASVNVTSLLLTASDLGTGPNFAKLPANVVFDVILVVKCHI